MLTTLRKRFKYFLFGSVPGLAGRFPYYGTTVHFPPGALVFRLVCEQGRFEPEIVDRLVRLSRPGTTVLDVGANIGLMAIPVLRDCEGCRVISFEPSPSSLPWLRRTAVGSAYADRWRVVGKALSREAGELDFVTGGPSGALFDGFRSNERLPGGRVVRVPVSTLDLEWEAAGRPDVSAMKIDVEGAEAGVLEGGESLVRACRPAILVEWFGPYLQRFGTPRAWLASWARAHRYRIFTIPAGVPVDDERMLGLHEIDGHNFVLLAEERA